MHEGSDFGEFLVDSGPINGPGLNDVVKLEDDQTVAQIRVEIIHEWTNAHRIHPIAISYNRGKREEERRKREEGRKREGKEGRGGRQQGDRCGRKWETLK